MSLSIQASPILQSSTPAASIRSSVQKSAPATTQKTIIESDTLQKSALSGAVRGGLTSAGVVASSAIVYVAAHSNRINLLTNQMGVGIGAVGITAVTGAAAGLVSSQTSTNPVSGAAVGAFTGAATGAATFGLLTNNLRAAGVGAIIGGISGMIGGAAGTYATEKK